MIEIRKSPSADSRSATHPVTVDELRKSTEMHQADVSNALRFIAEILIQKGIDHDHTKMEHMDEFHQALTSGHIKDSDWYQMHITEERHHLKSKVPKDVNLFDVIEHVADCIMAGLARSGEVYDIDLPAETLLLAVTNTVELLKQNTRVIDEDGNDDIMNSEVDSTAK